MVQKDDGSLPMWLTAVVVLTLTALFAYNIIVNGPEGLPTSYVIAGLLGAYAGVERLLKRNGPPGGGNDTGNRSGGEHRGP